MVGCQPARACLQSVSAVSHVVQSSNLFLYALQRMCSARGHRRVSCHLECDFACSESETGTWPSHHVDKARPQVEGQIAELEAELAARCLARVQEPEHQAVGVAGSGRAAARPDVLSGTRTAGPAAS